MEEKAIIEKIKRIRTNKNITLKALAKKTGLTEGYLSRIENSENAPPISTLSRIAQGLDIDTSYLFSPENKNDDENPNIVIVRKDIILSHLPRKSVEKICNLIFLFLISNRVSHFNMREKNSCVY